MSSRNAGSGLTTSQDSRITGARLAIWSSGVPHPTEGASTVLFWHYITGLRAAGFEVLHVILAQPDNANPKQLEEYRALAQDAGIEVAVCHDVSFVEEQRHRIDLRSGSLGPGIDAVEAFRPDLTFCLDVEAGWAASVTPGPRVVWLGDLRFQSLWYHALYSVRERPANVRHLPFALARRLVWRRAYRRALQGVATVIVASKSSEAVLRRLGVHAVYLPYPWPSPGSESARRTGVGESPPALPTFLFLGTLHALGSRSAFHFLFRRLYPRLVRRWGPGGFTILIAGRGELPGWAVDALRERVELVHVGFVEDLAGLLGRVHAAIAPISVPVGNRSRILTALAATTVVVAHENAALGNPDLVDGETCYLARDPDEFVERMVRCVESPTEARAVATRGRALYLSRFHPDLAVQAVVDTLASVIPDAPSVRTTEECQ